MDSSIMNYMSELELELAFRLISFKKTLDVNMEKSLHVDKNSGYEQLRFTTSLYNCPIL